MGRHRRHPVSVEYDEESNVYVAECNECDWRSSSVNENTVNDRADLHEGLSPLREG